MKRHPHSLRRLTVALAGAAAMAAVLGDASKASAEQDFPGMIQGNFPELGCPPPCTLCHVSPGGGGAFNGDSPPADKYVGPHRGYGVFVVNLRASLNGAPLNKGTLIQKLNSMEMGTCNTGEADTGACDSDGDGTSDFLEVKVGQDPDEVGVGTGPICPLYGCGASIGTLPRNRSDSGRAEAALAALGVALVFARRIRR